ncbi:MAG: hypothetical protein A2408_01525 [Candidatus Yonathbacteria bacterium RIFOXYC1_FULL_52_10]|nr:MAG: hypothetical protein A2408_01525 [Candidatus Yonathbacteria bacterium RIFOXYC1_FULL_52_10]
MIGFVVVLSGRGGNSPATKLPAFLSEANEASSVTINTGARYVHTDKSFSFLYPEGFTPKLQSDGEDGEVVVLEDGEIGVQIAAIPFDEDIALTPERIKQDLPDLITERTEIVSVGGAQAVAFKSTNASTASSNEVWFVHAGKLYLVSAPSGSEALVSGIIKTWEF